MKFVAIKWTFVILVSELCHVVTTSKPTISPAASEIVIQEGNELRLECQGEGNLHFVTMEIMPKVDASNFEGEGPGKCVFGRPRASKEDTGWYACAEEGAEVENKQQTVDRESSDVAWIYVYVNSSVPFAVNTTFDDILAVAGGTLVVPCRTTSPNLTPRLDINWGQTEVPADTKYDPKIGFILNKVGVLLSGQTFQCSVDGSEAEPASYSLVVNDLEKLKCPRINLAKIRHVIRGRNLSVDCEIDVPLGTKGFNMSWQVPKSVPEERLSIVGPKVVGEAAHRRTWKIELAIKNFEESYDGVYYCIASAVSDFLNTSTTIKSLDPEYTYITATVDGPSNIVPEEKENAQWRIEIDSYPEEFDWKWYDPHNQVILHKGGNESAKYSHSSHYSGQDPYDLFRINDRNLSDNGNYTIEFSNKENRTVVNLKLTVRAQPSVRIDKVKPYYSPGESADFTCHSYGEPLPNITWFINEYPNITSKESLDVKLLPNPTTNQGPKGAYHVMSTINVIINHGADLICKSCNELKCVESTERICIVAGKPQNNILWISIVCVLVSIIIVIACLGIRSWRRLQKQFDLFERGDLECINPTEPLNDQANWLSYDMGLEISRDKVKLLKELGRGAFGVVKRAEVRDIPDQGDVTIVAVKMVQSNTGADMEGLIRELKIMIHVGRHENIVNLLGACTRKLYSGVTRGELYVIVEYCRRGNLYSYLENHKIRCQNQIGEVCFHKSNSLCANVQNDQPAGYVRHGAVENVVANSNHQDGRYSDDFKPIHTEDLLKWALQVSQGMEHLRSKNVLHRDLATRNILLADNDTVKICDFGLAKNIHQDVNYAGEGNTLLPIKWMAVESIVDGLYSTKSDVWSFGIVLWEFFTLADEPYKEMEAAEQTNRLVEGYRMGKPEDATDEIYNIMRHCWKTFPDERPTFSELTKKFSDLINGSPSTHDASANYALPTMDRRYVSMNNGVLSNGRNDHPTSTSSLHRELPNVDVNINIRVGSPPLQMSSPTISDFEYCNQYPGPLDIESCGEQQADMSEKSYNENPTGRDSGYSSVARASPPPNVTLSTQSDHNPLHHVDVLFPDRGGTVNVFGEFPPSDSEDDNEYVGMLEAENPRARGAGSSGQGFEDTPVGKVSGYCNIASIPAPPDTSNQSSKVVTYVPVVQNGNPASRLVSKKSNYVARPDGI